MAKQKEPERTLSVRIPARLYDGLHSLIKHGGVNDHPRFLTRVVVKLLDEYLERESKGDGDGADGEKPERT